MKTPEEILLDRIEEFHEASNAFAEARRVLNEVSNRLSVAAANLGAAFNMFQAMKDKPCEDS